MNLTEPGFLTFLLGLTALCVLLLTALLFAFAVKLWPIFRRLESFVSHGERTVAEAGRVMGRVGRVVDRTASLADDFLDQVDVVRRKVHAFWAKPFRGNRNRLMHQRRS